jgi:hypothetical protein
MLREADEGRSLEALGEGADEAAVGAWVVEWACAVVWALWDLLSYDGVHWSENWQGNGWTYGGDYVGPADIPFLSCRVIKLFFTNIQKILSSLRNILKPSSRTMINENLSSTPTPTAKIFPSASTPLSLQHK